MGLAVSGNHVTTLEGGSWKQLGTRRWLLLGENCSKEGVCADCVTLGVCVRRPGACLVKVRPSP